jgi:ribosomal protein S18 acetylase RimI-like enzyme
MTEQDREMPYPIEIAYADDAEEILALQKLAYRSEAALIDDDTIEPLVQTLESRKKEFESQLFLKITKGRRIIGSAKGYQKDSTCYIGKVIVHPELQNRGIGKRLMQEIESRFPSARRFELFTGSASQRNIAFYQKLGYQIFDERQVSGKLRLVFMEKRVYNPTAFLGASGVDLAEKNTKLTPP